MICTVLIPTNQDFQIHIPKNLIGRTIEIIAFDRDEIAEKPTCTVESKKYRGILNMSKSHQNYFDKHSKEIRNEW